MSNPNAQALLPDLLSLGINFSREKPKTDSDVERTLIRTLPFLREDLKLLRLVTTWALIMGDLVHVERLKALGSDLNPIDWAFLGGIASHVQRVHKKWKLLVTHAEKKTSAGTIFALHPKMNLAVDTGHVPADPEFSKFGLRLPTFSPEDQRKFIPRKYLVEDNLRLNVRALFGCNWRADIAYLLSQDETMNPYQLAKELRCSYETAHRIKNYLDESHFNRLKLA
jgi:hypothetical protein